jgi:N-formylglutamate amidohydrolase
MLLAPCRSRSLLSLLAVPMTMLTACGGDTPTVPGTPATAPSGPVGPLVVGQVYADAAGWIEYIPGDAPVVIVAPHGGALTPSQLPDRACSGCVVANDLNTQDLARAIVDAFRARTGLRPHLVINRLHRRKFDANRDLAEASGGAAALAPSWTWFHAAIDSGNAAITRRYGRGLLIDLHGHAHAVARLELGYLLGDADLRMTDAALTASGAMTRTSIARLSTDTRSTADRGVSLLRGASSLGALLVSAGYAAVPSPADPAPLVGQDYFDGGYNTQRHGSSGGGTLDAIQIESHYTGVRDTEGNRTAFATAVAGALAAYLDRHYSWRVAP